MTFLLSVNEYNLLANAITEIETITINIPMEKRQYIVPTMEWDEVAAQTMLAASNEVRISNTVTEDDALMSNERRSTWGDFWAD